MDLHRVRPDSKSKDIASSSNGFRFQLGIGGNNEG